MYEYAEANDIAHERCGKLIVATSDDQLPKLQTLYERGIANGVEGVSLIDRGRLAELEPNVKAVKALHVASTGIIDYVAVAASMRRDFEELGGEVRTGAEVCAIDQAHGWRIQTKRGEVQSRALINCAGLHSDHIALMCGIEPGARIIPFRGEYFKLRPERSSLVRNLIYPVPDSRFPFLGVHFTRTVHHGIEAGPNAVLALAREGYEKSDFRTADVREMFAWPGFQRLAAKFWQTGLAEMRRSSSKKLFTESLQKLVPNVTESDLEPGGSGVRAQAVLRDGSLVDDFLIVAQRGALHVLNVPSPAATASLAIAEYIADQAQELLPERMSRPSS